MTSIQKRTLHLFLVIFLCLSILFNTQSSKIRSPFISSYLSGNKNEKVFSKAEVIETRSIDSGKWRNSFNKIFLSDFKVATSSVLFQKKGKFSFLKLKRWPIGWKTIPLDIKENQSNKITDGILGEVLLNSLAFKCDMSLRLIHRKNKLLLSVESKLGNILSSKMEKEFIEKISQNLIHLLKENKKLVDARECQLEDYKITVVEIEKEKQKVELDKIINPEKYRTRRSDIKRQTPITQNKFKRNPLAKANKVVRR